VIQKEDVLSKYIKKAIKYVASEIAEAQRGVIREE
jgi:hypothetical protein